MCLAAKQPSGGASANGTEPVQGNAWSSAWCHDIWAVASPAGIPTDYLNSYPVLKEFRNSIASVPEVAAFYAKESDDVRVNGYRQDA